MANRDVYYTKGTGVLTGIGSGGTASVEIALPCTKYGCLIALRCRVTAGSGLVTYVINQETGAGDAVNDQGIFDPALTVVDMNEPIIFDPPLPFKLVGGENSLYVSLNNDGGAGEAGTVFVEAWYSQHYVSPGLADN